MFDVYDAAAMMGGWPDGYRDMVGVAAMLIDQFAAAATDHHAEGI